MLGSRCNCRWRSWLRRDHLDGLFGPQVGAMNLAGVLPVDPLARLGDPGTARGGQRLLHGVPVHAAPDAGPPMAARAAALAALAAKQMAGRGAARPVPLGLRGVLALG